MAGQHSRMYKPRNRKPHEPGSASDATPPSPHNATLFRARRASGGVVSRWDARFAILFGQSDASLCAAKQRNKSKGAARLPGAQVVFLAELAELTTWRSERDSVKLHFKAHGACVRSPVLSGPRTARPKRNP